jgi:hypothetical protein
MEGLHSRLKGHSELIEQLWNGVDYQHRNAVQASEIVDNYKKRDHQNRWSFGYGVHNKCVFEYSCICGHIADTNEIAFAVTSPCWPETLKLGWRGIDKTLW